MKLFKKKKTETVEKYISTLTIYFIDGRTLCYDSEIERRSPLTINYKRFYKWYFGRPQSESFTMLYAKGETTFLRKNISMFKVGMAIK